MICLIDGNNIVAICFHAVLRELQKKNGIEYEMNKNDLPFFYHMLTKKIVPIVSTYKDVIFCFDSSTGKLWRKNIYPPYKENRKKNSFIDKDFFENIRNFFSMFQCNIFVVDGCEGDDLIFKICELEHMNEQIFVISSDGDFVQLMNYFPSVSVYNPIRKTLLKENRNILLEKSLIGDVSDNIKGVSGIGKKTLEKMLEDKAFWNKKMTTENIELQSKILQIVDLRLFSKELQDRIEKEYRELKQNTFKPDEIEAFFFNNGMNECLSNWGSNCSKIQLCLSSNSNNIEIDDILDLKE